MSKKRVVVTGLGTVNPLALNVNDTWQALCAGQSGVAKIDDYDASEFSCQIAATVKHFDITGLMNAKEARRIDLFIQYALAASEQALQDAKLPDNLNKDRVGVAIGAGIGGIGTIEDAYQQMLDKGPKRISPFLVPGSVINMAAGNVAIRYGFRGPNFAMATACTSGTHNIGYAARTIAYGDADVMLAGGSEKSSTPLAMAGFSAARAMSTRNDDPTKASRPWDKDRDGFVLGDGAAVLVLESLEHAQARGAQIYAELCGLGLSDDAFHITSPPETGEGAQLAMSNALADAKLKPTDIDYINAHGTSTPVGDLAETQAIKALFGEHAYRLLVSSTKSMTGHLLGAAGALEALITVLSIKCGMVPPTINLDQPSEGCDLDYVAHHARAKKVRAAISNSFGFGGTNGSLVFRQFEN